MASPNRSKNAAPPKAKPLFHQRKLIDKFLSLKEGEEIRGIYMGAYPGEFGAVHKLTTPDGKLIGVNGRQGLDSQISECEAGSDAFPDGIIGHAVVLVRSQNKTTKSGRTVGIYMVGHDIEICPRGCKNSEAK